MDADTIEPTTARSPETVDRTLIGLCGAIWLVLIAASVFAVTALVRLGSGQPGAEEDRSSWLLYSIIAISALVIIGAVPLLLRARRAGLGEAAPAEPAAPAQAAIDAPTEKVRVFGVDPSAPDAAVEAPSRDTETALDRVWLRGTAALLAAIGLALTAVAIGTYLLAAVGDNAAWAAFGTAAVITVGMPAVLVFFGRQVDEIGKQAAVA